jgi:hypothetical protein
MYFLPVVSKSPHSPSFVSLKWFLPATKKDKPEKLSNLKLPPYFGTDQSKVIGIKNHRVLRKSLCSL